MGRSKRSELELAGHSDWPELVRMLALVLALVEVLVLALVVVVVVSAAAAFRRLVWQAGRWAHANAGRRMCVGARLAVQGQPDG